MAGFLAVGFNTQTWLTEVKDIFSEKEFVQQKYTPSFNTAFRELTQVFKEQISSWWEVQSLENYIEHHIVPRGLRITLIPSARCQNPTFLTKWEKLATDSSIGLMTLLLEEERQNLSTLETKLKEHIEIVKKFEKEPEYTVKETTLQTNIEKFQYHIKDRKHKQFIRDVSDFKENKAYSFAPVRNTRPPDTDISTTETDVSDSDLDTRGRGQRSRRPYRGRSRGGQSRGPIQQDFLVHRPPYHLRNRNPN